jgi:hypothetical protein
MVYHVGDSIRTRGGEGPLTPGGGARLLNRNQKATARQLSLAAYLLASDGRARGEARIRENLPPYAETYTLSLLDGSWYLTGRDLGREDLRQFRLSRIQGRIIFATERDAGDFGVPEDFERRLAGAEKLLEPHAAHSNIPSSS